MRKFLLTAIKELQQGKEPPHLVHNAHSNWFPHIDCFAHLVPRDIPWRKKFNYLMPTAQRENPMSHAARKKAAS